MRTNKWLVILFSLVLSVMSLSEDFKMTIMHINDHHSHLEPETIDLNINGKSTRLEYGSISRVSTEIQNIRNTEKNVLTLHAGDALTGTLYYTLFKGEIDAKVMNQIKFDAFTLGNHEFDDGDAVLANFLKQLETPIIAANVKANNGSPLVNIWKPYIIKQYGKEKVGIIGIATSKKTKETSNPSDKVEFIDEVTTTKKYVSELQKKGINKIIVLTHFGYDNALELAKQTSGVDVIISGDQHALLGSKLAEVGLNPVGEYPTKIMSKKGEPVYVAEAWQYSFLLGKLDVIFDKQGLVKSISGDEKIVLGDKILRKNAEGKRVELEGAEREAVYKFIKESNYLKIVEKDPKIEELLKSYSDKKQKLSLEKVGESEETILGGSANRIPNGDNPSGSYVAAVVAQATYETLSSMASGKVDFVIQNAGTVRTNIEKGDITIDTVYTVLPYANTLYVLDIKGSEIKQVLEEAIDFSLAGSSGGFPYAYNLRYEANKNGKLGERVTKIEIFNSNTNKWELLDNEKMYKSGANAYIASGKDGYVTFGKITSTRGGQDTYITEEKSFLDFVKKYKTIKKPETTNVKFSF